MNNTASLLPAPKPRQLSHDNNYKATADNLANNVHYTKGNVACSDAPTPWPLTLSFKTLCATSFRLLKSLGPHVMII